MTACHRALVYPRYVEGVPTPPPDDVIAPHDATPDEVETREELDHHLRKGSLTGLTIQGLGRFTEYGSALLIMGIAGGAVIPQLFVHLKQVYDFQLVFVVLMVPCYLYILYFARRGHKAGQRHDVVNGAPASQHG